MKKFIIAVVVLCVVLAGAVFIVPLVTSQEVYTWEEAKGHIAPGQFVQAGTDATHYIVRGEGPHLILIHGFLYNTIMWKEVMEPLAKGFRVHAIDLLGWGYSSRLKEGNYSYQLYADQLLKFMDALGITQTSIVGQSMGGGTAILFATQHPERVRKIVLVDAAGLPNPLPLAGRIFALPYLGEFLLSLPRHAVLRKNIQDLFFYDPTRVTNEYMEGVERPFQIKGSGRTVLNILRTLDFGSLSPEIHKLGEMGKPILLLWGREDKAVPLPLGEEMHKILKGSEMKIIEKAGHIPHEEHPEEAARLMIDFLSKQP